MNTVIHSFFLSRSRVCVYTHTYIKKTDEIHIQTDTYTAASICDVMCKHIHTYICDVYIVVYN
jgi:hypothetical protein